MEGGRGAPADIVVSTVVALGYAAWRAVLYLHATAKDAPPPAVPQSATVPAALHQHSQDTSVRPARPPARPLPPRARMCALNVRWV